MTAPARRELVRWMSTKGLSERHCLKVVCMSASALRYQPRPDRNVVLRQRIVALAQRHRRYGAAMIYLKLRQAGELVNHKRVERLYTLEKLQVRRRRRKKIPVSERQPLVRPGAANEVWSARGNMPTIHLMGGTIMGTEAGNSVVNSYGQTHEIPNLYVAGPGIFATCGASNTTYTIFALSLRGAEQLAANWATVAG